MNSDAFGHFSDSPSAPARRAYAINPHNQTMIEPLPKALFVGGGGTLTLRAVDSDADVTIVVSGAQILPVRASHIRAAGTTATGIVGLA